MTKKTNKSKKQAGAFNEHAPDVPTARETLKAKFAERGYEYLGTDGLAFYLRNNKGAYVTYNTDKGAVLNCVGKHFAPEILAKLTQ